MKTTTEKPTLESLGLKCTIVSNGIGRMNEDEKDLPPMLKWNALFTNVNGRPGEMFDYYTGSGCVPWDDGRIQKAANGKTPHHARLGLSDEMCSVIPYRGRRDYKDKTLLSRTALAVAKITRWQPDPIEILWAIARDGDALDNTFEDWCGELGYDADSRRAEKIYRACQDNFLRLKKILSVDKIEIIKALEL